MNSEEDEPPLVANGCGRSSTCSPTVVPHLHVTTTTHLLLLLFLLLQQGVAAGEFPSPPVAGGENNNNSPGLLLSGRVLQYLYSENPPTTPLSPFSSPEFPQYNISAFVELEGPALLPPHYPGADIRLSAAVPSSSVGGGRLTLGLADMSTDCHGKPTVDNNNKSTAAVMLAEVDIGIASVVDNNYDNDDYDNIDWAGTDDDSRPAGIFGRRSVLLPLGGDIASELMSAGRTFRLCSRVTGGERDVGGWEPRGRIFLPRVDPRTNVIVTTAGGHTREPAHVVNSSSRDSGSSKGGDGYVISYNDAVTNSGSSGTGDNNSSDSGDAEEAVADADAGFYSEYDAEELIPVRAERIRREGRVARLTENFNTRVLAIRLEKTSSRMSYTEDGRISVLEDLDIHLSLVGVFINNETVIKLTTSRQEYGEPCGYQYERHTQTIPFTITANQDETGGTVVLPAGSLKYYAEEDNYYVCVRNSSSGEFVHQGDAKQLQIEVYTMLLPVWLMVIMLLVLLILSGLFSGLNLGLMSLDQTELRIVMNTGSETEKSYAKAIMPIRGMGNFLLCSILLGNVLVNNTLTIILDTLTGGGGIIAVIGSTLAIVIFGEIIPQAICSRHGLAVGAKTIYLTKFFMFVTSPLAFPLSKILDKVLGTEIGTVYNRERLMELIKVTDQYTDLERDEVNIVTGALVLKRKSVRDVMTHLDDCYMLPIETILTFEAISEIKDQGYSRIPVYKGQRCNVVHILFARDLLFIDPDDNKPLEEICKFYKNDVNFVYQDTVLTDMFDEFKSGDKGHMALVQEPNTEGEGDPFYETVGLVTLEDIIEEIIQQEIVDETDVVIDNKTKKKRKRDRKIKDAELKMFLDRKNQQRVIITPQMSLAVYQFLTTSVKAFASDVISSRVMQKLLNLDVYRELKLKSKKGDQNFNELENEGVLMAKGKPCDYFILILEGRVEVTIGREEHKFIEGPFTTFGEQMLEQIFVESGGGRRTGSTESGLPSAGRPQQWIPDYSLKAVCDIIYLKIRKNTYTVALKASRMNNMNADMGDKEIDYALERVTEDDGDEFENAPTIRSPDKSWDLGLHQGSPELRRESMQSSFNRIKSKILGSASVKSSGSLEKSMDRSKEDFWDGMSDSSCTGDNQPPTSGPNSGESSLLANQVGKRIGTVRDERANGPVYYNGGSRGGGGGGDLRDVQSVSEPSRLSDHHHHHQQPVTISPPLPEIDGGDEGGGGVVGTGTTVITVKGNGAGEGNMRGNNSAAVGYRTGGSESTQHSASSPNDRTSLLQNENPVS